MKFHLKKGWKSLFDGKSKKGWHIYRGEATGESWQVEDGLLTFTPVNKPGVKTGGDLTTDEEYENYHLSVEWKYLRRRKQRYHLWRKGRLDV